MPMDEIKTDLFPNKLRESKKKEKKDIARNVIIPAELLPEPSRPKKDNEFGTG